MYGKEGYKIPRILEEAGYQKENIHIPDLKKAEEWLKYLKKQE